ncbi:uncharacterized protein LOC121303031 [Polyodon spathula]|uniref:uncharacterized protein LOC121303031 n=1 Tax=Polyodon spathula TaxID=7913 RepID=UPI001B7EFCFB|nr:uncharacterized protein LOC121303031 [Polyodon spathula]
MGSVSGFGSPIDHIGLGSSQAAVVSERDQKSHGILPSNGEFLSSTDTFLEEGDVMKEIPRNAPDVKEIKWAKDGNTVKIPYSVSKQYDEHSLALVKQAFSGFEEQTCVRFVPVTTEEDYIVINPVTGCYSSVGHAGGGQLVSLGLNCIKRDMGVATHVLMHVLGFWHEHTRVKRDKHIAVKRQNISPELAGNFKIRAENTLKNEYDYNSVLHYSQYAFSVNQQQAATPIPDTSVPIRWRKALSESDIKRINTWYNCDNHLADGDQGHKNADSHLLVEKPLQNSERDVLNLGVSPPVAAPITAAAGDTTGPASSTPFSAWHTASTPASASPASSTPASASSSPASASSSPASASSSPASASSSPASASSSPASASSTPASSSPASASSSPASASSSPASASSTPASASSSPASASSSPASASSSPASASSSPASASSSPASASSSPASASSSPAPASSSPASASSTPAPASSSPAPASSSPAPASSTPASASSTPAPASSTPAPASSTPASASSTPASASSTPASASSSPASASSSPASASSSPASASSSPASASSSPASASSSPASAVSSTPASSQADLSVRTSTGYDQTTLQSSEVTQSLLPNPSPRPASLFCDFELDLCGWENCSSGDFNWLLRRERPAEFETQTLPDGHASCRNFAGQYLYLEAVFPRESGETAVLISPVFEGPKCLSFWYSLIGDGVGALNLYVQYVSSPDSWHKLWSASGAMPRKWYFQQLDLFVKAEEEYQILLEGTIRNNYCGDAAIDDLSVSETLCMPLQKRLHRRRELPATAAPEGSPSVSIAPVLPPPEVLETLFCDFEKGLCGWSQCTSDEFDWELHQERLPPLLGATQPDSLGKCRNLEGQYLYMEAVYPRESGQTAVLISPAFKGPKCLSFWYSLFGDGVGSLNVYVQYVSTADRWHKLWSVSGNKSRKWHLAELELFVEPNETFQILLEGTIGNSPCGDVAVDDVFVTGHHCVKGDSAHTPVARNKT